MILFTLLIEEKYIDCAKISGKEKEMHSIQEIFCLHREKGCYSEKIGVGHNYFKKLLYPSKRVYFIVTFESTDNS